MKITWTPRRQDGWSHGDTWTNEFSSADGLELEEEVEFEQYYEWSMTQQSGVIKRADDEFLYIQLDSPGPGGRTLVAYPLSLLDDQDENWCGDSR